MLASTLSFSTLLALPVTSHLQKHSKCLPAFAKSLDPQPLLDVTISLSLKLHNCGLTKSLSFLRTLRYLDSFRFVGTDIIEGDLSPLLNISDVFFGDKKHYWHKLQDIRS